MRKGEQLLYQRGSERQRIALIQDAEGVRLELNGVVQFHTAEEKEANEYAALPLALAGETRNVLVLGGGTGLALREALAYPGVESITLVELDTDVLALARQGLQELNKGALEDPRVHVVQADALQWVARAGDAFDAIINDADLLTTGTKGLEPGRLVAFYRGLLRLLRPGGVLSLCFPVEREDRIPVVVRACLNHLGLPVRGDLGQQLSDLLIKGLGSPLHFVSVRAAFKRLGTHQYFYLSREPLEVRREPPTTAGYAVRLLGKHPELGMHGGAQMVVRRAAPDDAAALVALASEEVTYSTRHGFYTRAGLRELLSRNESVVLVAERGGRIEGFLLAFADPGPEAWVEYVAGGQEAVRAMAAEAIRMAGAKDKRLVRALVREDRREVETGLAAAGFSAVGTYAWLEMQSPFRKRSTATAGITRRPARPGDAAEVHALLMEELGRREEGFLHESAGVYGVEDVRAMLASGFYVCLVAERAGRVVGFMKGELDGKSAEVGSAVVAPAEREGGVGTALWSLLLEQLEERGIRLVYFFINERNARLIRSCEKLGARQGRTFKLVEWKKKGSSVT